MQKYVPREKRIMFIITTLSNVFYVYSAGYGRLIVYNNYANAYGFQLCIYNKPKVVANNRDVNKLAILLFVLRFIICGRCCVKFTFFSFIFQIVNKIFVYYIFCIKQIL